HPNKVVWLVHQFRQAYELDGTELGQFGPDPVDRATRRAVHRLDDAALGEARAPPPPELDYRFEENGRFVLSVGRLDRAKRVDLLLRAAAADSSFEVVVAGDGAD